jgi:pimeloyl-ACP methyl ester carboxylesterase
MKKKSTFFSALGSLIGPLLLSTCFGPLIAQNVKPVLYLMPGFGSDARVFKKLHIESADTVSLHFIVPKPRETLPEYARRMAAQMDTSRAFYILGVSFGGMVAVEMSKFLYPEHIFLVASAKTRSELPWRYRFQKTVPLYRLLGGKFMIWAAPLGARIFEPEMKREMDFFKSMIRQKDPAFMLRAFGCIAQWDNCREPVSYTHIHGNRDHTLPGRKIKNARYIDGGHWAVYFNADEISRIVEATLRMN